MIPHKCDRRECMCVCFQYPGSHISTYGRALVNSQHLVGDFTSMFIVYTVQTAGTYVCSSKKIPEKSKSSAETIEFRNRSKNSIWIISGRQIQYIMHFRKIFEYSNPVSIKRLTSSLIPCAKTLWFQAEINNAQLLRAGLEYFSLEIRLGTATRHFHIPERRDFSPGRSIGSPFLWRSATLSPGQCPQSPFVVFRFRTHSQGKKLFAIAFAFIHSPWIANDVATDLIVSLFRFMVDNDDDDYTFLHAVISVKAWGVKFCVLCVLYRIVQIQ